MISILVLFAIAASAVPYRRKLISVPGYKPVSSKSVSYYIQPITEDLAYKITMKVTADSNVVHVSNLPVYSVDCASNSLTLVISDQDVVDSWPESDQLILFLDHNHECPHKVPIYLSKSWSKEGSSLIFQTEWAKSAGVDADIELVVSPIYFNDLYSDSGYDGYDFDSSDEIVNRTKVYPYRFDYNIERIFDIGSSGTFLKCDPCHVKGELDLVFAAQGTILHDFQASSYIGGTINGSFRVDAGLQNKMAGDTITLFRYALPEVELPGILYLAPAFAIYGVATLDSDEEINLNLGLSYHAEDFHITLMSLGHKKEASATLDKISRLETKNMGQSSVNVKTPLRDVNSDFGVALSIRPQLELGYKAMGYPPSSLLFALDSGVFGSFDYKHAGDVCRNHISGKVDARSSLIADIGFKKILKEGEAVRILNGCLG